MLAMPIAPTTCRPSRQAGGTAQVKRASSLPPGRPGMRWTACLYRLGLCRAGGERQHAGHRLHLVGQRPQVQLRRVPAEAEQRGFYDREARRARPG